MKTLKSLIHALMCLLISFDAQAQNLPSYSNNFRLAWIPVNGHDYNRGDVFQMGLDIDQDGWGEFLANDLDWGLFMLFEAQNDDQYREVYSFEADHVWVDDFNHDGKLEVLVGKTEGNHISWSILEWDGKNLDEENQKGFKPDPVPAGSTSVVVTKIYGCNDLDNDGNLEIISCTQGSAERRTIVHILQVDVKDWPNVKINLVYSSDEVGGLVYFNMRAPGYSDVDQNGFKELLLGMDMSRVLCVIPCTGEKTFGPTMQIRYPSSMILDMTVSPLVVDVDKDGKEEIYIGDLDGLLYILKSTGDIATTFTVENTHYLARVVPQWAFAPGNLNMFHNGRIGDLDGNGIPNFYYSAKDCESFIDVEYLRGDVFDSTSYAIRHTRALHPASGAIMHYSWWSMAQGPRDREWDVDMDRDHKREVVVDSRDTDGVLLQGWPCLVVMEAKDEYATAISHRSDVHLPETARLVHCYPNPFNAETTILFRLAKRENVSLSIYNIKGERVRVLKEGSEAAGDHFVQWDATACPSGLYCVVLRTGNLRQSQKIVLIR